MHYSSVLETAKRWDLSERSVLNIMGHFAAVNRG